MWFVLTTLKYNVSKTKICQGLFCGSVPTLNLKNNANMLKRKIIDEMVVHENLKAIKTKNVTESRSDLQLVQSLQDNNLNLEISHKKIIVQDSPKKTTTVEATDNRNTLTFDKVQTLQRENSNLKICLKEYKRKLNNKNSLLSKYRKRVKTLKQKLKLYSEKLDSNSDVTMNKTCSQFIQSQYRLTTKQKGQKEHVNYDRADIFEGSCRYF